MEPVNSFRIKDLYKKVLESNVSKERETSFLFFVFKLTLEINGSNVLI